MRVSILGNGVYGNGGTFTSAGGTMSGPLILVGNPTENLEAATKSYVDHVKNNLNASNINTGILDIGRLPSFSGDFTNAAGSNVFTLPPSGVVPGTYTKITVDAKGRVLSGDVLNDMDIPAFSWNKITSGKPTTLSGYGITDAISLSGGVLTGFLTLAGAPVNATQLATKGYVDSLSGGSSTTPLETGDMIRVPSTTTPTGFLRCNGGEVSKTTYAALYAVIGDTYSNVDLHHGSGKPWQQQYYINESQSTNITGWTTGTSLTDTVRDAQAIVTKDRVYLIGGTNSSKVRTAPINADGTLGTWTLGTAFPRDINDAQAIVTKNRVYLLGGENDNYVDSAPINADGTLGAWTRGPNLPGDLADSQAIVTKNRVYLLGGHDGDAISTVRTAPINADGTLGAWTTGTSLPGALCRSQAIVTKNRVYLLGGDDKSNTLSTVYTAPINSDGTLGAWTAGTSLPGALAYSQAIVTKNRVYLLGGRDGSITVSTVYTAPINADGTLGTWTTGTSLPIVLRSSQAIVTKNRVHLLGGYNSSSTISTVYTAPILEGLNDYSPYYDGTFTPTDPTMFKLFDTTLTDQAQIYTYIKT